jgi:hypothetical protein
MRLFPVGSLFYHTGHKFGVIVGHNGGRKIDNEEINETIKKSAEIDRTHDGGNKVSSIAAAALLSGIYSDGTRYPYIIQYEPRESFYERSPELREKYPNGYRDVYEHNGNALSVGGNVWRVFSHNGLVYKDIIVVEDPNDRDELELQILITLEEIDKDNSQGYPIDYVMNEGMSLPC